MGNIFLQTIKTIEKHYEILSRKQDLELVQDWVFPAIELVNFFDPPANAKCPWLFVVGRFVEH